MLTVTSISSLVPPGSDEAEHLPGIRWNGKTLRLLDQRRLPGETVYVSCGTASEVAAAIRAMVVRGAPAIGIAAAYGVALSARQNDELPAEMRADAVAADFEALASARPTAVNLDWALARLRPLAERGAGFQELTKIAATIHAEDIAANRTLAALGAVEIASGARLLTHCNTGPLATGGIGTAFGVIAAAWRTGRVKRIYFTETRPWLQGARLTAWEFAQAGIPATLLVDSAAASRALAGAFDWLVIGADRIAANGDVVNKIGTAALADLIRRGGGRVMVVAPFASVDLTLACGADVPIEQRPGEEVWHAASEAPLPRGIEIDNPVFDITPAGTVDLIVTERGVVSPVEGLLPVVLKEAGMVKLNN